MQLLALDRAGLEEGCPLKVREYLLAGVPSVIGYDDTPSAEFAAPRLTSVHMPWREMTLGGINALLNRCYDLKRPVARTFPVGVTMRASLARVAADKVKAKRGSKKH